jgi:hypothetical protein
MVSAVEELPLSVSVKYAVFAPKLISVEITGVPEMVGEEIAEEVIVGVPARV